MLFSIPGDAKLHILEHHATIACELGDADNGLGEEPYLLRTVHGDG